MITPILYILQYLQELIVTYYVNQLKPLRLFLSIFLLIFLNTALVFAKIDQKIYLDETISWNIDQVSDGVVIVNNEYFNLNKTQPVFYKKIDIPSSEIIGYNISSIEFSPINANWIKDDSKISKDIALDLAIAYEKKQAYLILQLNPLIKDAVNQTYKYVTRINLEVELEYRPAESLKSNKTHFASNSVLNSGNWYKIRLQQDGIYRLNYAFLKNLGLDVDNINPKNIRIYGNGGGMLPESNAVVRHDDLEENAILVAGEADNQFNANDYVLFYGKGPHTWNYNITDKRFHHAKHLYDNYAYYFITVDKGTGKRITNQASSTLPPNSFSLSFDDFYFYEEDYENLIESGRNWYGDKYDFTTNYSYNSKVFSNLIPNDSIYLRTSLAARAIPSTSSSNFDIKANGISIVNHSINGVGEDYTDIYANTSTKSTTFFSSANQFVFNIKYNKANSSNVGWLDYFELNVRRTLNMSGDMMLFRDSRVVSNGNITQYTLGNVTSSINVWDVTNVVDVKKQALSITGNEATFTLPSDSLKTFLAFTDNSFLTPEIVGGQPNQNLHGIGQIDMLIVTNNVLTTQANQLASFHETNDGIDVAVVTTDKIYNEFSSGAQDVTAIRDFVKMFYDRAGADSSLLPKYLLIFGDGSYDMKNRVNNNTNLVPTHQSPNSLNPLGTYSSDDFFGLLDFNEGKNIHSGNQLLDIAIGRLPVKNPQEASTVVNKIIHYATSKSTFGDWRNKICFVADDEDGNTHINQADNTLAKDVEQNHPDFNVQKIYLDAYQQISTSGASRYPGVNDAIRNQLSRGVMIMNYTGHGGEAGWAHERIFNTNDINNLENKDKLPLFITATCSFSKYDNPEKDAGGELLLLNPNGGAIALMTTVRIVTSGDNLSLNTNFLKTVLDISDQQIPTFGEVARKAKNVINTNINNRNFTLLGDPALKLPYPEYVINADSINGVSISSNVDTIKGLGKVTISGTLKDRNGNHLNNFNGIIYPTIYDKAKEVSTLANDPSSNVKNFKLQNSIIYKGKASVKDGKYRFTFITPKDIAQNYDYGKISLYADNGTEDAGGNFDSVIVGGTSSDFEADNVGPEVKVFLNDEKFVSGGITDESPVLIIKLSDLNGINTVGAGIGHDITAVLDGNTQNTIILNEFYEAELDNYQAGEVRYQLFDIEEGTHTLKVKAWDVYNNSSDATLDFIVASSEEFAINHVLNYPNPFTSNTDFHFEHNRPGDLIDIDIKIYTVSGKLVKTIQTSRLTTGYRIDDINWDGLDQFGDKIGRGVYIYKVKAKASNDQTAEELEKLVILR